MTDDELNLALARALEPVEPYDEWGPELEAQTYDHLGAISIGGMWVIGKNDNAMGIWVPRDFCRDGNAMLELWDAAGEAGIVIEITALHVSAESGLGKWTTGRVGSCVGLTYLVANVVAKALGVWKEDE